MLLMLDLDFLDVVKVAKLLLDPSMHGVNGAIL
jgi:hypothetical protein